MMNFVANSEMNFGISRISDYVRSSFWPQRSAVFAVARSAVYLSDAPTPGSAGSAPADDAVAPLGGLTNATSDREA